MNYQLVFDKAVNHWKAGKLSDRELNCYITGAFNAFAIATHNNDVVKQCLSQYLGLSKALDNQLKTLKISAKSNPNIEQVKNLISRENLKGKDLAELINHLEDTKDRIMFLGDSEMIEELDEKIRYVMSLVKSS